LDCAVGTQFLGFHANALLVLAEVLRLADRWDEVAPLVDEAIGHFDLKGNVVAAAKARAAYAEQR
jgi:hypothetical protein